MKPGIRAKCEKCGMTVRAIDLDTWQNITTEAGLLEREIAFRAAWVHGRMTEKCGQGGTHRVRREADHTLIRKGKRADLWGECACGQWAWLGTYEPATGRAPKLHAAHAEHVAQATR